MCGTGKPVRCQLTKPRQPSAYDCTDAGVQGLGIWDVGIEGLDFVELRVLGIKGFVLEGFKDFRVQDWNLGL